MDVDKILKSMTNIIPDQSQIVKIEELRKAYKNIVPLLNIYCNDSRELSIAVTRLEDSLMWAVKSIILNT